MSPAFNRAVLPWDAQGLGVLRRAGVARGLEQVRGDAQRPRQRVGLPRSDASRRQGVLQTVADTLSFLVVRNSQGSGLDVLGPTLKST